MATQYISTKADIEGAINVLSGISETHANKVRAGAVRALGTGASRNIKKSYKAFFSKDSSDSRAGRLYKSIRAKYENHKNVAGPISIIRPRARWNGKVWYGYALAEGSTIRAKKKPYLRFKIDGKWKTVKSVKLKERDYIEGPARRYLSSAKAKSDLDKSVQSVLNRLEKQGKYVRPESTATESTATT